MAFRSLLLLACAALAHAWQGAALAARPMTAAARSAVAMKHPEFFQRVQRSEGGRLRLCVSRYVCSERLERPISR